MLVLGGAVLLVASLFFDWYRDAVSPIDVQGEGEIVFYTPSAYSGWSSFEIVDILLLVCAAGALTAVARPMRLPREAPMVLSAAAVLRRASVVVRSSPL